MYLVENITPKRIIEIVESYYLGKKAVDICNELSIDRKTLDKWLEDFGHLANEFLKLRSENHRLREMYASLTATNLTLYQEIEDFNTKRVFR
ncbi:hypothetical protein [Pedobacter namyangjuensis]|uniref:hypothetical protein n=1 Tax=Pedobacter namyangjuensis TaxID=600626 RepID=UPI000DE2079C|nr:hypothetical protein [Pedobacter namyangjuensis]